MSTAIEVIPFEREGSEWVWLLHGDRPVMPIVHLAHLFEMDLGNANKIISRNMEQFDGYVVKIEKTPGIMPDSIMESEGNSKVLTCLTLSGTLLWINKLDYKRYSDEKRSFIIKAQRWIVETGESVLMRKLPEPTVEPLQMGIGDVFLQCIKITDAIVAKHHVEPIIGTQVALQKTHRITGIDMTEFIKLLPAVPAGEEALLTPTDIASRRGMRNAREVNKMLNMMDFQMKKPGEKKGYDWFPTDKGKDYCFSFPYVNNGHSGYQLKWKESILPIMDKWEDKHPNLFQY